MIYKTNLLETYTYIHFDILYENARISCELY